MSQTAPLETFAPLPEAGTAEAVTAARQAHAKAIDIHREAVDRISRAEAAHRGAMASRQLLLNRASAGEQVNGTEMKRAGAAISETRDAVDLSVSIAAGAATRAEHAHIAALRAEAGFLTANYKAAVRMRVETADKIDEMVAMLQKVIDEFNCTNLGISVLANGAQLHDYSFPAMAQTNAVLARLNDGDLPKTGVPHNNILKPVQIAFTEVAWGEKQILAPFSLAARERSLFGLTPLPPPDPERVAPPATHIFGVIPKHNAN